MVQHSRKPAVLVLALIAAMATAAWPLASRLPGHGAGQGTLAELELLIAAGDADARTWFAYGQRLAETGRHAHAAMAFRKALELDPLHRESRMSCATSLARSQQHDELAAYLHDLLLADAKLALDLFEDPALRPLRATPRFAALHEEARLQSLD